MLFLILMAQKMFITGPGGDEINEYTLSTAFDPTSANSS